MKANWGKWVSIGAALLAALPNAQAQQVPPGQIGATRVLAISEAALRQRTGELVDGPAALHFARVVAFYCLGELQSSITAIDLMQATAGPLPTAPGWIYELKYDGFRAVAFKTGRKVQLRSRNDKERRGARAQP